MTHSDDTAVALASIARHAADGAYTSVFEPGPAAVGGGTGWLHGLPIAVKDIMFARESATSANSRSLPTTYGVGRDATVVGRLRSQGAVVVGKTTTMEHALGLPDPALGFPQPRNPWDPRRSPGGSSAGSAITVARGDVSLAIGTDTCGSLRLPASHCGVTGFKPTTGLVPTNGVSPLSPTLDCVGPLARTAELCARALGVLVGEEPLPASCSDLVVGVVTNVSLSAGATAAMAAVVRALVGAGARVVDVELPAYAVLSATTALVAVDEAHQRFGEQLLAEWDAFGENFRFSVSAGSLTSPEVRERLAHRLQVTAPAAEERIFSAVDLVVMPTVSEPAPLLASHDPFVPFTVPDSLHTMYWNALGCPVASIPGPMVDGLPLGVQIAGGRGSDWRVLAAAAAVQEATGFHVVAPPEKAVDPSTLPSWPTRRPARPEPAGRPADVDGWLLPATATAAERDAAGAWVGTHRRFLRSVL